METWLAKQDFQIVHILETVGTVVVVGFLWRIASTIGTLQGQFVTLMTNHLPHLQAELVELRRDLTSHMNKGN